MGFSRVPCAILVDPAGNETKVSVPPGTTAIDLLKGAGLTERYTLRNSAGKAIAGTTVLTDEHGVGPIAGRLSIFPHMQAG